jgi:hypothetical protein
MTTMCDYYSAPQLPEFKQVLDEKYDLACAKNADYGDSFDKLMDKFADAGLDTNKVILVRLADKYNRFENLVLGSKQQVKDESVLDTLRDMSTYIDLYFAYLKKKADMP